VQTQTVDAMHILLKCATGQEEIKRVNFYLILESKEEPRVQLLILVREVSDKDPL